LGEVSTFDSSLGKHVMVVIVSRNRFRYVYDNYTFMDMDPEPPQWPSLDEFVRLYRSVRKEPKDIIGLIWRFSCDLAPCTELSGEWKGNFCLQGQTYHLGDNNLVFHTTKHAPLNEGIIIGSGNQNQQGLGGLNASLKFKFGGKFYGNRVKLKKTYKDRRGTQVEFHGYYYWDYDGMKPYIHGHWHNLIAATHGKFLLYKDDDD